MKHALAPVALLLALVSAAPLAAQSFGKTAVVAGDEVLIAQPDLDRIPGTVYVYRQGEGGWTETGTLTASDGFPGDRFGTSMALDGDRVVVGALWADSGRGAAYVFDRVDGEWREAAKLTLPDRAPSDSAGKLVALRGDLVLVGSSRDDAVHAFRRDASGAWTAVAPVPVEGFAAGTLFQGPTTPSIALTANAAVVGVPAADSMAGGVWVYPRTEAGWGDPIRLTGPEGRSRFGSSLAVAGDELLVGAFAAQDGRGAVRVYREEDGSWRQVGEVVGPEPAAPTGEDEEPAPTLLGMTLGAAADEAWAGAPGYDGFEGAIFRLTRGPEGWVLGSTVQLPEDVGGNDLSGALALGGDIAIIGLPGDDYGAGTALVLAREDGEWRVIGQVASEIEPLAPVLGEEVECREGQAGRFSCQQVDLLAFIPVQDLGGERGVELNDIWGWTDPESGKEYALVGRTDGTAFVDVTDPAAPVFVGQLPKTEGSPGSTWRDIKVYRDHAFIVADNAAEHGVQVFDLTRLRNVENPPAVFTEDAHYDQIHSAHNIVINTDSGFAYTVGNGEGGDTCGGGLHMIDIRDPLNPTFAGCFSDPNTGQQKTGYTHDAQCVNYRGPDEDYEGREICFGANETALSIADVTDKANPVAVAVAEYPNVGYTHQAWLTEDHRHLLLDDELDELNGLVDHTRTLIWDVTDLDDPVLLKEFLNPNTTAIDHNQYVVGDKVFQSNYVSGLRVIDISDIENPAEVGHFDTVPYGSDGPRFDGSWSNYPFFESGTIVVTSGDEGLFLLRFRPSGDRPIS